MATLVSRPGIHFFKYGPVCSALVCGPVLDCSFGRSGDLVFFWIARLYFFSLVWSNVVWNPVWSGVARLCSDAGFGDSGFRGSGLGGFGDSGFLGLVDWILGLGD